MDVADRQEERIRADNTHHRRRKEHEQRNGKDISGKRPPEKCSPQGAPVRAEDEGSPKAGVSIDEKPDVCFGSLGRDLIPDCDGKSADQQADDVGGNDPALFVLENFFHDNNKYFNW